MRVLFLDVDGVLNRQSLFGRPGRPVVAPLCPTACRDLRAFLKRTGVRVVLSSSWRNRNPDDLHMTKLRKAGILRFAHEDGQTVRLGWDGDRNTTRGDEIAEWLSRHPEVERYAIVDDDSDMLPEQMPFFVQTRFETGLLGEHLDRLRALLESPGPRHSDVGPCSSPTGSPPTDNRFATAPPDSN